LSDNIIPLLTIITVCYNAESTIRDCIQSVAYGKTAEVEYLIIDGASTDSTLSIAREYPNVVDNLISEPDNGIFDAMNKGLVLAKGKFVAFLNADDRYLSKTISIFLDAIHEDINNVDVFYGDWIGVNDRGEEIMREADHRLRWRYKLCHQAMIARRSIFPSPEGFDLRYRLTADFNLILLWQAEGLRFKRIPSKLVRFSEVGASSKFDYRSAWDIFTITILRVRFPWKSIFLIRSISFFARYTLTSLFQQPKQGNAKNDMKINCY
jgi:glycosyltransferase involved in cell wall biosynthesis